MMAGFEERMEFCIKDAGESLMLKAVESDVSIYCTATKKKASLRVALTRQLPFAFSEYVRLGCGSNEFEISRAARSPLQQTHLKFICNSFSLR